MANNHGIGLNKLLSDVGAITGIPVVVELCNLFLDSTLNPSIVVAPSTFAATHESIRELGNLYQDIDTFAFNEDDSGMYTTTKIVIIPPIVDTNKFSDKYVIQNGGPIYNPTCSSNCITVGFVARLSVEKNAGLFFMMARAILRTHPTVRFSIVGDGPLKEDLIALAHRLEISYAVKFMGWVDDNLPNVLRG
jgi:glycosyltransferase involved in cell wall biosynthesis